MNCCGCFLRGQISTRQPDQTQIQLAADSWWAQRVRQASCTWQGPGGQRKRGGARQWRELARGLRDITPVWSGVPDWCSYVTLRHVGILKLPPCCLCGFLGIRAHKLGTPLKDGGVWKCCTRFKFEVHGQEQFQVKKFKIVPGCHQFCKPFLWQRVKSLGQIGFLWFGPTFGWLTG